MFADDTTLSVSGHSIPDVVQNLNTDLAHIATWCQNNCMTINATKTKSMFLSTKVKLSNQILNSTNSTIQVNHSELEQTNTEKLLGVTIDNTLSWNSQVDIILKKCNSLLYLLCRIKKYLSIPVRKLFYNSYILPHLDYCCTVWGNCNADILNKLFKFQKRAARIILNKNTDTPSDELFNELKWLKIGDRIEYVKATLMYKALNDLAPNYLAKSFNFTSDIHNLSLRSTEHKDLYVPKPKTEIFRKSFAYSGSKLWNSLPVTVRGAATLPEFRQLYFSTRLSV